MPKRKSKWTITAIAILGILAALALLLHRPEPSWKGTPLSVWVSQGWNGNATAGLSPNAASAISEMGENATPHLVAWVHDNSPEGGLPAGLKSLVQKLPRGLVPASLAQWADTGFGLQRAQGTALAFAVLGERAHSAIPELADILADPGASNAARRAAIALTGIGTNGVDALRKHLSATNAPNRVAVAFALGWAPSLNTNAGYVQHLTPLLIQCVSDPEPDVRTLTVMFLSARRFDRQDARLAAALTNATGRELPLSTRMTAIAVLGEFGAAASNAVPGLYALLDDPNPHIRMQATNTLGRISRPP